MSKNTGAALIGPPVSYPVFEINGTPYQAKFSAAAMRRLKADGVDVGALKELFAQAEKAGDSMHLVMKLAAASLCTVAEDGRFIPLGWSSQELEESVDIHRLGELASVVTEGLKKVSPAPQTEPQADLANTKRQKLQ